MPITAISLLTGCFSGAGFGMITASVANPSIFVKLLLAAEVFVGPEVFVTRGVFVTPGVLVSCEYVCGTAKSQIAVTTEKQ
jgi:hypothetical protein